MNTQTYYKKFIYPICLILFTVSCIFIILPSHSIFGSEGDWFSQHAAIAEQFRTIFYETGQIFPDYSLLGSGSNIYDFSYYGFLRPDILFSFLLPKISLSYIISAYAILELIVGNVLCYFWLNKQLTSPFFAFLGGILYACAVCFYQAHHQIMFVNYMPFLLLALFGIEHLIEKGKISLFIISLFLVYLHSYYFAPAILAVVLLYFIHNLYFEKRLPLNKESSLMELPFSKSYRRKCWYQLISSIILSIGMAAILLLPTALDLLSTQKDAGTPASLTKILSIQSSFEALLYHPYGCGLTILCLYTLFLSIRRKSTRITAIILILCLTVNIFSYILSGFLYVRYKVLIPFVPLLVLLCARTLQEIFTGKEKHHFVCALCCLIPIPFSDYPFAMLLDVVALTLTFLLIYLKGKNMPSIYLLLCLFPVAASIMIGQREQYISISDNRQTIFSREELNVLKLDKNYRFEVLTEPYANVNTQTLQGIGRTNMYSSVTDKNYADFFYQTMRNPIRIRNQVALMTDANPFFSYLMGIRYIQTNASHLPWGYHPMTEKNNIVIAENNKVLPIAYTSTKWMSQKEYEKLDFPYSLEALTNYTIADVPPAIQKITPSSIRAKPKTEISAQTFLETSKITPVSSDNLQALKIEEILKEQKDTITYTSSELKDTMNFHLTVKQKTQITIPLAKAFHDKILICSFTVNAPTRNEVTIDINNIRNKLSGKNAPYPNHNHLFTYLLSSNDTITELEITLFPGDYILSNFQFWTMNTANFGNSSIQAATSDNKTKTAMFTGSVSLEENGYFVTSFPFRKGYKAYANGKEIPICQVNQDFVGISLQAGTYKIELYYSPPGKTIALFISFIAWLLFVVYFIISQKKYSPKVARTIFNKS